MRKILISIACALMLSLGAQAADTVPWSNDFSNYSASINGWKKLLVNSRSRQFTVSSGQLYIQQSASTTYNEAWLFFSADGFALDGGKGYRFDFEAKTNADNPGNHHFKIGLFKKEGTATPAPADVIAEIVTGTGLTKEMKHFEGYFEPQESGEYYLGLYVYADYASRALYFDNFNLIEASMDAPAKGSMVIMPDMGGVLKAEIKATAATKSIRGDALATLTKMVVSRDGGVIKTVDNPAPGSSVSFTDKVAQPGTHLYSVQCYNEHGAGAAYDVLVDVGGVPEAQSWSNTKPYWAKWMPDGKIRIEWPAASGVADYKVETLSGRVIAGTPEAFTRHDINSGKDIDCYYLIDDAFEAGTEPIGWQYRVSKVDEGGTATSLGVTNYICINNEVPYFPTMSTNTSLYAFTLDQDYQYGWQYYGNNGGMFGGGVSRPYGYADKTFFYNQWLISPGLLLKKDRFYRVKVTSCSDSGAATYTIKAGKGSYRDALDILVTENQPTVKGSSDMNVSQTDEMFLSVPEDGQYFVGLMGAIPVNVSSDNLRLKRFDIIEVDGTLPDRPTDVTVAYSTTGGNDGKITFKVPVKAINGSDVTGLTKIEILKDGEAFRTITEGVTPGAELSFDVVVTAGQQNVYSIRAYNTAGQGEAAAATVFVLSTPYSNDFNSKSSLNGFKQINNMGTSHNFEVYNERLRLFYDEAGHDQWLITPPITLTAGQYYQLNFNVKASGDNAGNLDVMLGNSANPEMLTRRLAETIQINTENNIFNGLHEEWFTVEETGQYFLGFHVTKEAGRNREEIFLDDLAVSSGVMGSVPDRGELKVIPAADGSLKAELVYTAPLKSLNGELLNANSTQDVYFYINNVQTGGVQPDGTANPTNRTFKACPGQSVSIEVAVPEELPYIFSARAGWNGRLTYKDAFIGINTPAYPEPSSIVLKEIQPYGRVRMSWDPVTKDIEGYDLNPELLKYEVMYLAPSPTNPDNPVEVPVLTDITGTSCEFDAIAKDAPQTMKRYVLRARNSKGKGSSGVLTSYVNVGKPYRMPYRESFAGDDDKPGVKTAIFSENLEGATNWGLMYDGLAGINSADGDGCYLAMEIAWAGSTGRFYTGKVNLGSGIAPSLSLSVYNPGTESSPAKNLMEFKVYNYTDGKWYSLGEARTVSEICNNRPGWNKVTYDLSDYADNVVICAIEATGLSHTFTSIDNIRIWEMPTTDLSLKGHNTPVSVSPGVPFDIDVTVANNGLAASTPDNVEMYVDDELVQTIDGDAEINAGEVATYKFSHSFPAVDLAGSHEIKFKVNLDGDSDPSDNESVAVAVATVNTDLPVVENLTASADENMVVTLGWDAPSVSTAEGPVTESFENWEAGEASQFGWTSYDADGRNILGVNDGSGKPVVIPGLAAYDKASFAVIDNTKGYLPESAFPAKTGNKFLMSICPGGGTGSTNDWIISPLLSGNAQDITFNVRSYAGNSAGYAVMYSEGGMNLDSFKPLADNGVNSDKWQEQTCSLPEGAKRFAIRHIAYCEYGFMFMIDDVTYEPASGDATALLGYNVYSEGECLASPETNAYTSGEPMEEGDHVFGVSARYANGESKVVPVEVKVVSGVAEITGARGVHVFGGEGCIHITGADGLDVAVYDLSGRMICSGEVPDSGRVSAARGTYVVVAGSTTRKVVVK